MTLAKIYYLRCDCGCGRTSERAGTSADARRRARRDGWQRVPNRDGDRVDACFSCAPTRGGATR